MASFVRNPSPAVADRLPPGQVLTEKFPVLQFGQVPSYPDLSTWDFRVWGAVERPLTLSWAEVRQLPVRQVTLDIHCVTRWSKLDTTWEGAAITHLAETVGVQPDAGHVIFHSEYGYTANVPLAIALQPDALHRVGLRRQAARTGAWLSAPGSRSRALLLEEREMAPRHRVQRRGPPRVLGAERVQQQRRPVARGALLE